MTFSRSMHRICVSVVLIVLFCSASRALIANLGQTEVAQANIICDTCLEFSTEAQMILSDPGTQQHAIDLVSQLTCQSLIPSLKTKCLDLVNSYVPGALAALQAYLGPEICTEAGLCFPDPAYSNVFATLTDPRSVADAKTCVTCEVFAKDALNYLRSDQAKSKILSALHRACARLGDMIAQCDLLVDVYAPDLMEHLDNITPDEFCEQTHLCKPAIKVAQSARIVRRNDCAICQFVVLELKLKLRDPVTQGKILDVLLNGCNRVQNHVDECKIIVEQYAPFILANLDTILDADALCAKIGACQVAAFEAVEPFLSLPSEGQVQFVHAI